MMILTVPNTETPGRTVKKSVLTSSSYRKELLHTMLKRREITYNQFEYLYTRYL